MAGARHIGNKKARWLRPAGFQQITRSRTVAVAIELSDFEHLAADLLRSVFPVQKGIRLLGVTLSSLGDVLPPDQQQLRFEL